MPPFKTLTANVGELAKAMAERGLNGGELAREAGVMPAVISRARNGVAIRRSAAAAIAGALEREIALLFTDDKSAP